MDIIKKSTLKAISLSIDSLKDDITTAGDADDNLKRAEAIKS